MKNHKVIAKYLERYAELPRSSIQGFPSGLGLERCVVIPAFDESTAFVQRLQDTAPANTLVIVVLNCPPTCTPLQRQTTQAIGKRIADDGTCLWTSNTHTDLSLIQTRSTDQRDLYWLVWNTCHWDDAPLSGFTPGVGYARRLGMDTGLHLQEQGHINNPYLLSTDADASLPAGYFSAIPSTETLAGYIFPFQHHVTSTASPVGSIESQLYELSLRYYVLGLRWAQCPWDFHTIGSTLAIHRYHYAANRGFPKREAGEDFYLLNKLAKTGELLSIAAPTISLSDRPSHRVPFGTGPAIEKLSAMDHIEQEYCFYDPRCFHWLRTWFQCLPRLYQQDLPEVLRQNGDHADPLCAVLDAIGVQKALTHSRQHSRNLKDFTRHMLTWFDAFKTLKFIHGAREQYLPSISTTHWMSQIHQGNVPFIPPCASPTITDLLLHVRALEHASLPRKSGIQ